MYRELTTDITRRCEGLGKLGSNKNWITMAIERQVSTLTSTFPFL